MQKLMEDPITYVEGLLHLGARGLNGKGGDSAPKCDLLANTRSLRTRSSDAGGLIRFTSRMARCGRFDGISNACRAGNPVPR